MRALVGAIIAAGASIGFGLVVLGIGHRYSDVHPFREHNNPDSGLMFVKLTQMDGPLIFALVFTASVVVIGLAIAIAGLAYHHLRREREYQAERERYAAGQRTAV